MKTEDETLEMIDAAKAAVAELSYNHDARILAAVLLSRSAWLYQQLRMAGIESKDTLEVIFAMAHEDAQKNGARAAIVTEHASSENKQ